MPRIKIAIYSRIFLQEHRELVQLLFDELLALKLTPIVYHDFYLQIKESIQLPEEPATFATSDDLPADLEYIVSIGGDGTLLDTVTYVRNKPISILGINIGRLGFLATINQHEIKKALIAICKHTYIIDKRTLIHLDADEPLFGDVPFALNDFCIHKRDTDSMIKINTYLNGEFLNTYWADGLIVATPTGSTGYSLSCGGPIVFPESGSFVISPISPHNLNMRPIIVPDENIISFEVESRSGDFICTLDARKEIVSQKMSLAIRKETFDLQLLRLHENSFLKTIQNKLVWGLDKRN